VLVELDPVPNLAVGRTGWGLSTVLPPRRPGTSVYRVGPGDTPPAPPAGRPLVIVTRDAARIGWQRAVLARLLAARPDAVVVEMGLAVEPPPAAGYLATHGASRASAVAAADVLLGSSG
jgi:beta-N-acetylhexosaminidase